MTLEDIKDMLSAAEDKKAASQAVVKSQPILAREAVTMLFSLDPIEGCAGVYDFFDAALEILNTKSTVKAAIEGCAKNVKTMPRSHLEIWVTTKLENADRGAKLTKSQLEAIQGLACEGVDLQRKALAASLG